MTTHILIVDGSRLAILGGDQSSRHPIIPPS